MKTTPITDDLLTDYKRWQRDVDAIDHKGKETGNDRRYAVIQKHPSLKARWIALVKRVGGTV